MLHTLAFLAMVLVAAPQADVRKGDKVYVSVPVRYAVAPIAEEEDGLRELFGAIRAGDIQRARLLAGARRYLYQLPGLNVEVVEVRDGSQYPVRVPTALVETPRRSGGTARFWIPVQYVRPKGAPLPHGEYRLPAFLVEPSRGDWLTTDLEVTLYDYGSGGIIAAADLDDFALFVKAEAAHNTATTRHLMRAGKVFYVSDWTAGRVVDGHVAPIGKRGAAVKVRLVDGPSAEKEVWVAPDYCQPKNADGFLGDVSIVPWHRVKRDNR